MLYFTSRRKCRQTLICLKEGNAGLFSRLMLYHIAGCCAPFPLTYCFVLFQTEKKSLLVTVLLREKGCVLFGVDNMLISKLGRRVKKIWAICKRFGIWPFSHPKQAMVAPSHASLCPSRRLMPALGSVFGRNACLWHSDVRCWILLFPHLPFLIYLLELFRSFVSFVLFWVRCSY